MGRYDNQTLNDRPAGVTGDLRFIGLNMKAPRETLGAGYCPRLENKRLSHGARTRPASRTPLFANLYPSSHFVGSGVYSNPNGHELGLLVTDRSGVMGVRSGTVPATIPISTPLLPGVTVELAQHFDKVLLHQSDPSVPPLVWDGLDLENGFVPLGGPSVIEPGVVALPNPPWSINYMGRAWFPINDEPDYIGASDVPSSTGPGYDTWDSELHKFRVNTGTADSIVGIYPYLRNNLIVAKRRSIQLFADIPDDLGDSFINAIDAGLAPASAPPARVSTISDQVGILARKSGLLIGNRFMFLSDAGAGGIYQIATDNSGNYIVDPKPVSDAIEPLIQRINWTYAGGVVAQLDGIYAYWAVPLDAATYNNAMLVLNVATGEWESVDFWNAVPRPARNGRTITNDNPMKMDNLFRMNFYGSSALFAANHSNGKVHLMYVYQGTDDQLGLADSDPVRERMTYPIQDVFESRGYMQPSPTGTVIEAKAVHIALATLEPALTFAQIIDGSNGDESNLGPNPLTLSRQTYSNGFHDYALDNRNGDAEAPQREDYAVHADDNVLLGPDGVRMQRTWPWTQPVTLQDTGRFISFRVANNGGICEVRSVEFESASTRSTRTT